MTKRTESQWRALVAEHDRSGMTAKEFAGRHDITPNTLYWWRSHLRRRQPDTALVPVSVLERDPERPPPSEASFELCLDDRLKLRIPAGFDEGELRRLLKALRC